MREFEFRGKRVDNGEWVYGYLVKHFNFSWILQTGYETDDGGFYAAEPREVDTATVGQYIGLRDNHGIGKDICKGDIVRVTQGCGEEIVGEVVWDEDRLQYAVDSWELDELYSFADILHCEHLVEIIGTRWEHPELPEEGRS